MEIFVNALNYISGLGATCMMPIVIIVLGAILRLKFTTVFRSGILVGVGFCGVSVVTNYFISSVGPSIQQMVTLWGLKTDIMDVSWPARAAATWAVPIAGLVILVVLGVNILMLVTKLTRCVMVDFWSYNHFVFTAAITWYATDNVILALIAAVLDAAITFKLADISQPYVESYFGVPGMTYPTSNSTAWMPLAWLLEKIYSKIPGLNKLNADSATIQKKFGIIGEPAVMGLVLGCLFALLGQMPFASILTTGMASAASMVILPKMMSILLEGLMPIADGVQEMLSMRFQGEKFSIGVDAALTCADSNVIAVGLLMMPTTLLLAAVLPGNRLLPLPDLAIASMWLAVYPVVFSKGNIVKSYISSVIIMSCVLLISTSLAPAVTQLAVGAGYELPEGMTIVGSQDAGEHLIAWGLGKIFGLLG